MSGQRPTLRRGLPYGWWKRDPELLGMTISVLSLAGLGIVLFLGWYL